MFQIKIVFKIFRSLKSAYIGFIVDGQIDLLIVFLQVFAVKLVLNCGLMISFPIWSISPYLPIVLLGASEIFTASSHSQKTRLKSDRMTIFIAQWNFCDDISFFIQRVEMSVLIGAALAVQLKKADPVRKTMRLLFKLCWKNHVPLRIDKTPFYMRKTLFSRFAKSRHPIVEIF